jgi:hypothetical protein
MRGACKRDPFEQLQAQRGRGCAGTIVGISVAILVCLFAGQRAGTSKVGFAFAPIIIIWYSSNVMINLYNIITYYPGEGVPVCTGTACKRLLIPAAAGACMHEICTQACRSSVWLQNAPVYCQQRGWNNQYCHNCPLTARL